MAAGDGERRAKSRQAAASLGGGRQQATARAMTSLSHPIFKTNQVLRICMPGSSSIHIVTSLVNNKNNIT
jgi:hypothetical protein